MSFCGDSCGSNNREKAQFGIKKYFTLRGAVAEWSEALYL